MDGNGIVGEAVDSIEGGAKRDRDPVPQEARSESARKQTVWIDLDNTPHVPFFAPVIVDLERRGYSVVITARDAFQVCELATRAGMTYETIGRHHGKNRVIKVLGLIWRSIQLVRIVLREKPVLGLSHGSRSQILLCNVLRIPSLMINDYEHSRTPFLMQPRWEIVPEALRGEKLHCRCQDRVRSYGGIKEDVYVTGFIPDREITNTLRLDGAIVATVRPPATEAHYHNPESEKLFVLVMNRLVRHNGIKVVLLPRNKKQEIEIRRAWPGWFDNGNVVVPEKPVDGLNLLWHSDFVVSGGGTMNREAAALGVPVYSIFRGKIGAVDRQLEKEQRLTLIGCPEDVESKMPLTRRVREDLRLKHAHPAAMKEVVDHIEEIISIELTKSPGWA